MGKLARRPAQILMIAIALGLLVTLASVLPAGPRPAFLLAGGLLTILVMAPSAWAEPAREPPGVGTLGNSAGPSWPVHLLAIAVPVLLVLVLYRQVVDAWWLGDDPSILWAVLDRGIFAHFLQPEVWRTYQASNFTPLLILSLGIDWHLFALAPAGYYWHQLLSLFLVLGCGYFVLVRHLPAAAASLALTIFVASTPAATVVQWLMTRHYADGLALSLLSCALFLAARGRSGPATWAAALLYLGAAAAKEVYVPLPLLLPLLISGGWRDRCRRCAPFLVMLGLYLVWRTVMLGPENVLAGYGDLYTATGSLTPGDFAARIANALGWRTWPVRIAFVVPLVIHLLILVRARRWQLLALIAGIAGATAAPLIVAAHVLAPRTLFAASFLIALWLGLAISSLRRVGPRLAPLYGLILLALALKGVASSATWNDRSYVERYRSEGEFLLEAFPDQLLLDPVGPPWFYKTLGFLRQRLSNQQPPAVCYDLCLCEGANLLAKAVRYQQGRLVPAGAAERPCGNRPVELSVELSYDGSTVQWSLGPYSEGSWFFVDTGGWSRSIPGQGAAPFHFRNPVAVMFRYCSPAGWESHSPRLTLHPGRATPEEPELISWSRGQGVAE